MLPETGDEMMAGGDSRPQGVTNSGIKYHSMALRVNIPRSSSVATPGYYMMHLIDETTRSLTLLSRTLMTSIKFTRLLKTPAVLGRLFRLKGSNYGYHYKARRSFN